MNKRFAPDKLKFLFKGSAPVNLPYAIPAKYCFILPTRFGLIFAAVLVAVLIAAINYNNNLAFALGFILISMGLVSAVHTHAQLKNLQLTSVKSEPVFAGETLVYSLVLRPAGRNRCKVCIRPRESTKGDNLDVALKADEEKTVRVMYHAAHRGSLIMPELIFSSDYPFGIFRTWHRVRLNQHTLIYPAKYQPRQDVLACFAKAMSAGGVANRDEFSGLREYVPGDRRQVIAWKASAKGLGLRSKEFSGDSGQILQFLWPDLPPDDPENKISLLTSLILEAESRGSLYEIVLPDKQLGPGRGMDFMFYCLRDLAFYPF
ncbi:MAG: DUF58 domain-containing protein [Thermodesulfobacteriota bacterium]